MRKRPGSGPLGWPFHHLSKQAWRAWITKKPFRSAPYQAGFGQNYTFFLYASFWANPLRVLISHQAYSEFWGPVTTAGEPYCVLNNSPLNLFFQLFLSQIEQSLAKVMGQWAGGWLADFAHFNIFAKMYWAETKGTSLLLLSRRAETCKLLTMAPSFHWPLTVAFWQGDP